jgi:hypothetical protein
LGDVPPDEWGLGFWDNGDDPWGNFASHDCPLAREMLERLRYNPFPGGDDNGIYRIPDEADYDPFKDWQAQLLGNFFTDIYDPDLDKLYTVRFFVDRQRHMVVVTLFDVS